MAGVTKKNAVITGATRARGIFSGGHRCGLPLDSGVILSTGSIYYAEGPNNATEVSYNNGTSGDSDLSGLVGGGVTHDAIILEFDIISTNAFTLGFQYFYASEEYPRYINTYNDPMAIFVSTNFDGTNWINNITNDLALVPGTTNMAVNASTINGGNIAGVAPTNAQYYVDNYYPDIMYSSAPPYAVYEPVFNTQYNGMTVLLTVQIQISANVTNHVKIAIADFNDHNYDSAVFIHSWTPCK